MKKFIFILIALLAFTSIVYATDAIYLKNGKKYYGKITDINEKTITIKTSLGKLTYPWTVLKIKTIKQYNPSMYEVLRAEKIKAFENKKKKLGLVKYEKNGKIKWVLPEKKEELEMRDKGMKFFEDKWMPTNKIAEIKYSRAMKAAGKIEYKGKWYTEEELADFKAVEINKGLKEGMTSSEVKAKWGKPSAIKKSQSFQSKKAEMWFYDHEKDGTEDRVYFENGVVRKIQVGQELSEH
ncbi:MAG: hypothetical protein DRI44_03915 [Chlamydiae bacterium]|nr:MAG: hypothetical protein DRI44_03915 [Chlamydiota bacterium]